MGNRKHQSSYRGEDGREDHSRLRWRDTGRTDMFWTICRKSHLPSICQIKRMTEETSLCRRAGPGDEWQTGATGDNGGVERFVYQTQAET